MLQAVDTLPFPTAAELHELPAVLAEMIDAVRERGEVYLIEDQGRAVAAVVAPEVLEAAKYGREEGEVKRPEIAELLR